MVVVSALGPVGGRWRSGQVLFSSGAVGVSAVVRSVSGWWSGHHPHHPLRH